MWLTRIFVNRPTLVTVFLALVLLAGGVAGFTLVQQQFPSTDVPSIQVLLSYPGASTTEMRDAIVRPLEDQLAGAPDLDHLETSIQPGQASVVAVFALNSDQNNDLVQVQGRVQNAQHQLPNDLTTPQISLYNPSEAVVVSLILRSRSLGPGDLSVARHQQDRPGAGTGPGRLVRPGQRHGHALDSDQRGPEVAVVVRLHADRHRLDDHQQQRPRARRHPLLAEPRDQPRRARRHPGRPDRRQSAPRLVGRGVGVERLQRLDRPGPPIPHRRRRRRPGCLRAAAGLRVLERRAVHYARRAEVRRHERDRDVEAGAGGAARTAEARIQTSTSPC